ncbi:MAG: mechanosensitive ion channel, partial [Oscillospiraceae bacterium]|nr:mechanosensitive ion channel [Oscillospiraceae bacterium]
MSSSNPILNFFITMLNNFLDFLPTLLLAIIVFVIGCVLNSVIMNLLGKGMEKSKLDKTIHRFLNSLVKIIIFAFVLIIVLTILGIPMDSIVAVVSSAGVAIGLAMQSSLSNVAGGFMVLIGRTFKVGDYVQINGMEGVVEEITILSTKIITGDNKDVFIPNGTVVNSVIINYSQEKTRRVDQIFSISYNNDSKKAVAVIQSVVEKNELILKDPEPFVKVSAFSPNSIDITVKV